MLHFAYDVRFESVGAYLDAIAVTRDSQGYASIGKQDSSVTGSTDFHGPALDDFVMQCRTMHGFEAAIEMIEHLSTLLTIHLPTIQSVKRQRTTGRSGMSVNIHAVNRGNFAHAWRRMERIRAPGGTINYAVLLPAAWGAWAAAPDIAVTMACNVALVQTLEMSGRTCDVWSMSGNNDAFMDRGGHRQLVHLKTAGAHWNIHNMACITSQAWYRRLGFRMLEAQQNCMTLKSSLGGRTKTFWRECAARTTLDLGYHPENTILGASQDDNIGTSMSKALMWLERTLHTVTKAA